MINLLADLYYPTLPQLYNSVFSFEICRSTRKPMEPLGTSHIQFEIINPWGTFVLSFHPPRSNSTNIHQRNEEAFETNTPLPAATQMETNWTRLRCWRAERVEHPRATGPGTDTDNPDVQHIYQSPYLLHPSRVKKKYGAMSNSTPSGSMIVTDSEKNVFYTAGYAV